MAGTGSRRGGLITEINVTPLVDIMLVLLIVFMLTANLISRQAIEVELPKASQGSPTEPTTVSVSLTADGKLYLNGDRLGPRALDAAIRAALKKDPKTQAIIAADRQTQHGRVVWVIDLVKRLGVAKFAIHIDPTAMVPPEDAAEPDEAAAPASGAGA